MMVALLVKVLVALLVVWARVVLVVLLGARVVLGARVALVDVDHNLRPLPR